MPIDFSPLYAPVPESPTSRGLRSVGDALSAVLARRQQMEQARLQREQQDAHARMVDQRVRDTAAMTDENADLAREEREHRGGQAQTRWETNRQERKIHAEDDAFDRAYKAKTMGLTEVADRYTADYERLRGERLTREQAERAAAPQGQPQQAQPSPIGPQGAASSAAPPVVEAQPSPQMEQPRPAAAPPVLPPLPPPGPVTPPPTPSPAIDLTGAVANRAATPAPTPAPSPSAALFGDVDPESVIATWKDGQAKIFGGDREIMKAIESVVATVRASKGKKAPEPEKLQAMLDRRIDDIYRMRDRKEKEAERKDVNDEKEAGRRLTNTLRVDQVVKNVTDAALYKKIVGDRLQEEDLSTIAMGAASNSPMAKLLRGRWAKFGQGAGVLTDHDLQTFYESIGPLADRIGRTVQEYLRGTIPAGDVAEIEKAIDALRAASLRKMDEVGRRIVVRMTGDPDLEPHIRRVLEEKTPGYLPKWEAEQELKRVTAEAAARRKAGVTGAGAPATPAVKR